MKPKPLIPSPPAALWQHFLRLYVPWLTFLVVEGEPLIGISPLWSERAIGYLRQPYPVDPQVGMLVQITTRSRQRQSFSSRISQVGGPLEYITNALAKIPINALVDVGLPVVVDLPSQAMVRPGEIVDVTLLPAAAQSSRPVN